ncbi:MAG: GIY-YIG nuclease family protein [Candidatus Omnitrophota bacterium]
MYYIYILKSIIKNKTYTGFTSNIDKRLAAHNNGAVKSTKAYKPYKLIHLEGFATSQEAKAKEKFYKTTSGRRRLKAILLLAKKNILVASGEASPRATSKM